MDPQRHAEVKRVFREALRWPPADRAAVATALAEDEVVRDEALSLLAHHRDDPAPEDPADAIGAVVDERYRIAARVRAGVYRAEDAVEGRPVALEPMPEDAAPVEALVELSRQAGAFVRVEGECAWQGPAGAVRFALVEWLDGPTLAELRAGQAAAGWPLERAIGTLAPIAEALAIAADRGIVHRAVRADRVVLTGGGGDEIARLAGLPAARASSAAPAASRIDAAEAATAAPEQLSPALGPIGPWTDVYGLALLCVELMLGRPAAGSATVAAAFARTRDEAAQPTPRGVGLEVPDAVQAVLARALAMRPMERYQDVRRFWTALRESLPASPPAAPAPRPSPPPPRRRSWPVLAAAALAALAALVALAAQRCG